MGQNLEKYPKPHEFIIMALKLQYFSKNVAYRQLKGSFLKTEVSNLSHVAQNDPRYYDFQKFVNFSIEKSHRCQN